MRKTTVEVDDELMALIQEAMQLTGHGTPEAMVEAALRLTVELERREAGSRKPPDTGSEGDPG